MTNKNYKGKRVAHEKSIFAKLIEIVKTSTNETCNHDFKLIFEKKYLDYSCAIILLKQYQCSKCNKRKKTKYLLGFM